jgi:hypothetical protein
MVIVMQILIILIIKITAKVIVKAIIIKVAKVIIKAVKVIIKAVKAITRVVKAIKVIWMF